MNKCQIVGRMTKDPDIRYSQSNVCVARFSVAVDRRIKKEGEPSADFPNVVAFNKTAEFIEKYFHKGMKIGISGRIQTDSYDGRDGNKVYTTTVVAEEVEFVESKQNNAPAPQSDDGFMNIPEGIEDELPFSQPRS